MAMQMGIAIHAKVQIVKDVIQMLIIANFIVMNAILMLGIMQMFLPTVIALLARLVSMDMNQLDRAIGVIQAA